jgi:hypothetical protein
MARGQDGVGVEHLGFGDRDRRIFERRFDQLIEELPDVRPALNRLFNAKELRLSRRRDNSTRLAKRRVE